MNWVICKLEAGDGLSCQWCCRTRITHEFALRLDDHEVVCPWCFNFGADRPEPASFDGKMIDREVFQHGRKGDDGSTVRCSKCMMIGHFHEECQS